MKTPSVVTLAFSAILVSACTSTSGPETTIVNGQTAYIVPAVSMYVGEGSPTAQGTAETANRILTGTHGGGLPRQAAKLCPAGYTIVDQTEPKTDFYMVLATGEPSFRTKQTFTIVCN